MQKIVCELCGSKDFTKEDGVFVCQFCGCKYTLEEARKLMVSGTVEINRSQEAINILKNAHETFDSQNFEKAYDLYTEVLNIDADNEEAVLMRGVSAGWQSSVKNCRIVETEKAFNRAIDIRHKKYGDTPEFFTFCTKCIEEYGKVLSGISILFNNYEQNMASAGFSVGFSNVGLAVETNRKMQEYCYSRSAEICEIIDKIVEDYNGSNDTFFEAITLFLTKAYDYYKLSHIADPCILRNEIENIKGIQREKEHKLSQKRIDEYWKRHQEERQALELERASIKNEISVLETEINNYSNNEQIEKINQEIADLAKQKSKMSYLKIKDRKQIDTIIKAKQDECKAINDQLLPLKESLLKKKNNLREKIRNIDNELTKDRC